MKKRILSLVLALIMLASMATTAFASQIIDQVSANEATYHTSGAIKSLKINFRWVAGGVSGTGEGVCLVLMTKELAGGDYTDAGTYQNSYDDYAEAKADTALGIISATDLQAVGFLSNYGWTFQMAENEIPLNVNKTYYINIWTQRGGHFYPDALGAVIRVQDGQVQFVSANDDGRTYDESQFNFVQTAQTFDVTVDLGLHMTEAAGSGALVQTDLDEPMTDVVITADDGYYFPENYMSELVYHGFSITRVDEKTIKISGQPIMDTVIALEDPAIAAVAPPASADYTFGFAYDCQRSPAYPKKNGEVSLWGFTNPFIGKTGLATCSPAGDWSLTKLGTWADVDGTDADNSKVENSVTKVAEKYQTEKDSVEIWELKKDGQHVAYGPMVAYGVLENTDKDVALFIGDTRSAGDTGYFLSDEDMAGNSEFEFIADNTPNDDLVEPGEDTPTEPGEDTPTEPGEDTPTEPGEDTPTEPGEDTHPAPTQRPSSSEEELFWKPSSSADEAGKANPSTGDGFRNGVSVVMALSVLAGAAAWLSKKK